MSQNIDQPTPPTKTDVGLDYITLSWTQSADKDLPVLGYILLMDDGDGGSFNEVYNGKNFPNVLSYTKTGLVTGLQYKFKLQALNFNGAGDASNEAAFIICSAPKALASPKLVQSTTTTLTL